MSAEDPRAFSGKSAKGKDYAFCQRQMQVFTGKNTVTCTERRDSLGEFGAPPIGTVVAFKMVSGRIHDGQMIFDVAV